MAEQLGNLGYKVALWDLAPGMSTLERVILSEMQEVCTPTMLEDFSLDGIEIFSSALDKILRDYRADNLRHDRIVANGYNRSIGRHDAYLELFQGLNGYELYVFGQDQAIPEAQSEHKPVLDATRKLKPENLEELDRLARNLTGGIYGE